MSTCHSSYELSKKSINNSFPNTKILSNTISKVMNRLVGIASMWVMWLLLRDREKYHQNVIDVLSLLAYIAPSPVQ